MRIIVVDDDESVRTFAQRVLERAGYSVQTAADGKTFVGIFRTELPDVVVTDIFMPEMDGFEVIRGIKLDCPSIPIVAMSGGSSLMHGNALLVAKHLKASTVLHKPFTGRQLLDAVTAAFG